MKKGIFLRNSLILGSLLVSSMIMPTVMASSWKANTPSEIASLNKNGTYTVRSGDTVWAIGMHYNIKPSTIEEMNGINNPYELQIGTVLNLHIYDHGKKAKFTVTNPQGETTKQTLTNKDKLDKEKSFGQKVEKKDLTKSEKKGMNSELYSNKEQKQSEASSILQSQVSSSADTSQLTNNGQTNLTNATAAEEYLKQKLNLNNNNDIGLVNDSTGTDEKGTYYVITVHVKSYELQGGTGSAGTYKVYQNGNIVTQN